MSDSRLSRSWSTRMRAEQACEQTKLYGIMHDHLRDFISIIHDFFCERSRPALPIATVDCLRRRCLGLHVSPDTGALDGGRSGTGEAGGSGRRGEGEWARRGRGVEWWWSGGFVFARLAGLLRRRALSLHEEIGSWQAGEEDPASPRRS